MLSLMSYEHVRRSVSLIIHLVSVSFTQFRSINSVSEFITTGKILPHFKGYAHHLSTTDHIYIDISANSAPISVKYSYLHVPYPHEYVLCEYGVIWITDQFSDP